MSRRAEPEDLYTVVRTPELVDPVLVVQLEGWIDAAGCAAAAAAHVAAVAEAETVVRFDTEWLTDHRARRPVMHVVDGINTGLDWPTIEISAGRDERGADVLLLLGAEPDHNWRTFVEAVVGLARRFGVTRMVGLGAYPAAVPHTRPTRLSVTATSAELARGPYADATLDVPAGMESALERGFADAGVPALGLWAQVPHYIGAAAHPAASLALVEGLLDAAGRRFDPGSLAERALVARRRLDEAVSAEPSHRALLEALEQRYDDEAATEATLPSSDELAAEVERFLRSHDEEDR